jgi:nicotinamide-nucleotide amidase
MQSLAPLAEKIAAHLIERNETIAIAESSTGGLIAAALLAVPGASAYFVGGAVAYTKTSRAALLGIGDADLKGFRPSTEAYAKLLATRMRTNNSTTWALGETGAAGPACNRCGGTHLYRRRRPHRTRDYAGNRQRRPRGKHGSLCQAGAGTIR